MQVQFVILNCVVEGMGVIMEMIFENCFMYVFELQCMGVEIVFEVNFVVLKGSLSFKGVFVMVIDFCVLVSLVIVGFIVEGEIYVNCIYYLDCGYEVIEEKLGGLGVIIECVKE